MAVAARFYVASVTKNAAGSAQITLLPSAKGEDNKQWSKWTPSGKIELTITELAQGALAEFEDGLGSDFDIIFTRKADAE